ncbi:MAG: type 1 glutamine amidotransferase domain-containing protein [Deltaproteobacteria bacterium]|jgi:putative intracellular protease/amidase|nr:type 1 glutamine amidotransferase domain-containing protein [Deltaproteobacteria bacterium]
MAEKAKILIVSTAHAELGSTGDGTGVWFEELTTPYYAFRDAGHPVDIVTIGGGKIPIDPKSYDPKGTNPASVERFLKDDSAMAQFGASGVLAKVGLDDYGAIFVPGGHGAMWDLGSDPAVGEALTLGWAKGLILSSVCHGPSCFVNAKETDGRPLVAGKKVNSFSDSEEREMKLEKVVPFLLESKLRELGAIYEKGPDFGPHAVRDGRLVTGQNPASAEPVASLVIAALKGE